MDFSSNTRWTFAASAQAGAQRNRAAKEKQNRSQERFKATAGFEPAIRVLQTPALPLGYVAAFPRGDQRDANPIKTAADCQICLSGVSLMAVAEEVESEPKADWNNGKTGCYDRLRALRRYVSLDDRRTTLRGRRRAKSALLHGLPLSPARRRAPTGAGEMV